MLRSVGEFLSRDANLLLFMVVLPVVWGALLWLFRKHHGAALAITAMGSIFNLLFALGLYLCGEVDVSIPLSPFGFEYLLRIDGLSALFILIAAAVFVLIGLYTVSFLKKLEYSGLYLLLLFISIAFVNGALLSDGLGMMLLFWEGLMGTLFGLLLIRNKLNPRTAVKGLAIVALSDLMLMLGIILVSHLSGASEMSEISRISIAGPGVFCFFCVIIGVLGQMGVMPFHSWIPSAAEDAPTVFMAAFPGALQVLLGVYLALRVLTQFFDFVPGSGVSLLLLTLGAITVVFASAMALIQQDMRRLVSYCAVSLAGLLLMGLTTVLPSGLSGALLGLVNYVVSISGLFMICGIIERTAGTTLLSRLGKLKKLPVTAICFVLCSLSAVGFPGLGGFFSRELMLRALLQAGAGFYFCALLGTFLMALALLKMGRSLFFEAGKTKTGKKKTIEPTALLLPVCIVTALSVLMGPFQGLFLRGLVKPALGESSFAGWHFSIWSMLAALAVLALAAADHHWGTKKAGNALGSTDHIRNAPLLKGIYTSAEKGYFDPYNWLTAAVGGFSLACTTVEHGVSWFYDKGVPGLTKKIGLALHRFDNGHMSRYLILAVSGLACIAVLFILVLAGK